MPASSRRLPGPGPRFRAGLADRLPVTVRAGLLAPSAPAVAGVLLAAVAAVLVVVVLWRAAAPAEVVVPPRTLTPGVSAAGSPAAGGSTAGSPAPVVAGSGAGSSGAPAVGTAAPEGGVVVDVAGKVRHPGVVDLPTGARVVDALAAAGGALPGADLRAVNLARKLVDGEQVLVLAVGERPPAVAAAPASGGTSGAGVGAAPAPGALLDLNGASVTQLDALPGVGPVLAQRIVDWRAAHGRFTAVTELQEVTGIGAAKFADLQPLVTV